jgi:hypothetical protein
MTKVPHPTGIKILTKIHIDPNSSGVGVNVPHPDGLVCIEGCVVWVVNNNDPLATHTISIDSESFIDQSTGMYSNPLTEDVVLTAKNVPAQNKKGKPGYRMLHAAIKPGCEGKSYKYDILLDGTRVRFAGKIDPDLDVVEPGQ